MKYHLMKSEGKYAIYTSVTDKPWNETIKLEKVLSNNDGFTWVSTWEVSGSEGERIRTFSGYLAGSFDSIENAIEIATLESL